MIDWGKRGVTVETASMVTRSDPPARRRANSTLDRTRAAPPSRWHRSRVDQKVGHHGRGQHLRGGDLLAVAGVHVRQSVAGVLDLDGGEVGLGCPIQLDASAGIEGEISGIGCTEKMKPQPVRIVLPVSPHRGEEALGCGVGPDHESHVAQSGQNLGPGAVDGLGPRGTSGVGGGHPAPVKPRAWAKVAPATNPG